MWHLGGSNLSQKGNRRRWQVTDTLAASEWNRGYWAADPIIPGTGTVIGPALHPLPRQQHLLRQQVNMETKEDISCFGCTARTCYEMMSWWYETRPSLNLRIPVQHRDARSGA